jgi:phosphoribosyl 1,2-cyclic phosphodiesterase
MRLTFLGTRGNIEAKTERHARHTALEVAQGGTRVMIDCGKDWLGEISTVAPDALVLTHAHEDHTEGLKEGAPCPVYATVETWERIGAYPIVGRHTVRPREPVTFGNLVLEAFRVQHSLRAPAVGYRISSGGTAIFYVPDVVFIHERREALAGVRLYIGDGATVSRSFVRREGDQLFGHTPVRTQLTWCRKEGVTKMIVSHCGTQIVTGEEKGILDEIAALAREREVEVEVAWDGMVISV